MRSPKSRSRSKNNRNRSLGNVANRVFDSSGPEGKVRGTPQQIIDKYNQLARDAQLSNDRVAAENFQQHAEHYLRMLAEVQREMEARREQADRDRQDQQAERRQAQNDEANEAGGNNRNPQDPSQAPQPDIGAQEQGSMLVETPESRGNGADAPASSEAAAAAEDAQPAPEDASRPKASKPRSRTTSRAPRNPAPRGGRRGAAAVEGEESPASSVENSAQSNG